MSKKRRHIIEAHAIGDDSWSLINFQSLPKSATVAEQVDALKADRKWQENHIQEVARNINNLIKDIEATASHFGT